MKWCRSGSLAAATEAPLFGEVALFIEGEQWLDVAQWLDAEPWYAGATMAAIVIRTINIAAQAATMVAEGARSSEAALLCEAELQYVGGARMLPIVVVDADGKHN